MNARAHRGTGKSDPFDARRIAASVLSLEPEQVAGREAMTVSGLHCGFWSPPART